MNKMTILAFMLLMGQKSWAQIREFQTTRLNSTAGAGVASVLSTEAALLNPASSAFFSGSNLSYQSYSTSLRHESDSRTVSADDFPSRNKSQGFFVSDHDGPLKGGVAYISQQENNFERKQIVAHGASALGERTALGLAYRNLTDTLPQGVSDRHKVSHQVTLGMTQILDDSTTLGLVLIDPTRTYRGEERLLTGFQFTFASRFNLIADIGAQYTKNMMDKHLWRVALQVQLFDDFFFRAGQFYDNIRANKGSGWGVSWIGPKLGVEFAQKFTDQFGEDGYIYEGESLVDTSLSAIIKF